MPGVAECAVKDNKLVYVDIRGYQAEFAGSQILLNAELQ